MFRKLTTLLILLFVSAFHRPAFATHAFGAELTYTCIGTNQYLLHYTFYRDCSGIQPPASPGIDFTNTGGLQNPLTVNLTMDSNSPQEIPQLCPAFSPTTCGGGTYLGVQKYSYSGVVTFPGNAIWTASHTEAARSSALTTITGAGSDNLYVYCTINTSAGCDNSPYFNTDPSIFYCLNNSNTYTPGVMDADGDSLVLSLITPKRGPNSTVNYRNGYSATQPVVSSPAMTFDPANGTIVVTPTQQDISVTAILVNEYRNGILIGQVERDFTMCVQPCADNAPTVSGFNGSTNYAVNAVAGDPFCFYVTSSDADASDTTRLSIQALLPGMVRTNSFSKHDSMAVCWTPQPGDTSGNPHCITVSVTDDHCPINSVTNHTFCITVSPVNSIPESSQNQFALFPNPVTDQLNVKFENRITGTYIITDVEGRVILQGKTESDHFTVDFSNHESGIYFLNFVSESGTILRKLFVK